MSSPTPSPATKNLRKCSPRPFQLPLYLQTSSPGGSVPLARSPPVSSGQSSTHAGSLSAAFPGRSPAPASASPARSARSPTLSSGPSPTPALSGAASPRRRIPFVAALPVPIASYPAPEPPLMVDVQCFHCETDKMV